MLLWKAREAAGYVAVAKADLKTQSADHEEQRNPESGWPVMRLL